MRPDETQRRRSEQDARRDFADGERLVEKASAQSSNRPRGGDDDDPLQQHELEVSLDGDRVHKSARR